MKTLELSNLSPKTRKAIEKYGYTTCKLAYTHHTRGEGASTVASYLGLSGTNAADAAINAGREMSTGLQTCEFDRVYGTMTIGTHTEKKMELRKFLAEINGKISVRFILGEPGRVVVSIEYATWTNWRATLTAIQFDAFVRSLPEGTEVSKF